MKLEQLLAIFSLALGFASFLALAGFWAYLLYMAFSLNLFTKALTLTSLLAAHKLFDLFGRAIYKALKEGKQPREMENEE